MLFFFITTTNKICSSLNRVVRFLLFVLFICCILPSITNAYPHSSSSSSSSSSLSNINSIKNRHWIMSNEKISNNNKYLNRVQRGTGYYLIRQGDYFLLIPDSKHHFTKNMRPYIGRRR